MEDDLLRDYTKDNILTTTEVSKLLGITKQMVSIRYRQGKLKALKETANGLLFYYPDIISFQNNGSPNQDAKILLCGNTRKSITFINEQLVNFGKPSRIDLFFNSIDAILHGFYSIFETDAGNELYRIQPITMSIKDDLGNLIWTDGCNCGYRGSGPAGSKSILKLIGIPDNLIKYVNINKVIKYFNSDNKWNVRTYNSFSDSNNSKEDHIIMSRADLKIFKKQDHFVLLQADYFCSDIDPSAFLKKYSSFLPNPTYIKILNYDDAKRLGYYYNDFQFNTIKIYQVIIVDLNGNELWLNYPIDKDFNINNDISIQDLFNLCGIPIKKNILNDSIIKWIEINLFSQEHKSETYSRFDI